MRRLLVLLLLAGFAHTASAQLGFGPEVGVGMSTFKFAPSTYPIDYTSASVNSVLSGKVGFVIDEPINKHMYFQAGLSVSLKGCTRSFSYYQNDSFNEAVKQTLTLYYADLPVNLVYKTGIQGKGRVIFGIGATSSYLVGGKTKLQDKGVYNDTAMSTSGNYNVIRGETLHGFDIALNLSAGYELPTGLFFRAYYTTGVNDIGVGSELDKNRMWGISAGYLFGKGRNINKDNDDLIDHSTDK